MIRTFAAALSLGFIAIPALADSTSGTVAAYDRKAQVIVLEDKTVWDMSDFADVVPEELKAGDRITIDFRTNSDSGFDKINAVTIDG